MTLKYNGKTQFHDHSIYRGYLSTVEDFVHFGLGANQSVDTLKVVWPDGNTQELFNVKANQVLQVRYSSSQNKPLEKNRGQELVLPGNFKRTNQI